MPSERANHYAALADDVRAFHDYLRAERGMAVNTILAYRHDLDRFAHWIADSAAHTRLLRDFLLRCHKLGVPPFGGARNAHAKSVRQHY